MSKEMSRKKASLISTIMGLINSAITICLTFLIRTVVLREFGVEYVGLYSLLSQTIGILAGVDGGVSSALFIKMHKPIADNNIEEIHNSYFLIRVVYHIRGILVLVIGMVVAFFLPQIANTSIDMSLVLSCYFAFLILNSFSYFFIYDYFMLETVQKRYVASAVVCIVNLIVTAINIICVYKFHNYFVYIVITSLNQIISYFVCRMVFRSIRKNFYKRLKFEKKHFQEILSLLGMAFHTFSNILITNSDTIIMSSLLSLVVTGYYANYYLIITGVNTFAMQLTLSIKDPFRNLAMTSSDDVAQINIKRIVFLYAIVVGAMGITYSAMADFFVEIFWGSENIIVNQFTVYLLAISFYLNILSTPIVDYYYCKEYYRKDKISPIIEIVVNIVLSIVLAKLIGLDGIIIGTIVTYLYRFIHRSKIVYGKILNKNMREMLVIVIRSIVIYIIMSFGSRLIIREFVSNVSMLHFLIWAVIIFGFSLIVLCCFFVREKEMKYYRAYFLEIMRNVIKR